MTRTWPFRRPSYNQRACFLEYGSELESPVILSRFYKMVTVHATNMPQNMRKYESYSRATVKNDSNDVTRISDDAQKSISRLRVTSEWYVGGTQYHMIVGFLHVYSTHLLDRLQVPDRLILTYDPLTDPLRRSV